MKLAGRLALALALCGASAAAAQFGGFRQPYRAPSPDKAPYVSEGSVVSPETVVCIVEAMKLMNEIQAETSGEIVKIYVENGAPVEYGQPLFGIRK